MGKDSGFIPRGARQHNPKYAGGGWFKPKADKPVGRDGWKYRSEHTVKHAKKGGCLVLAVLALPTLGGVIAALVHIF